jgi:hypothetical protein
MGTWSFDIIRTHTHKSTVGRARQPM